MSQLKTSKKDLNRHLSKHNTHVANEHMKTCSTPLVITKMQLLIEITIREYFTSTRKAIIFLKENTNKWYENVENWTPPTHIHHWWECEMVQPLWKRV